MNNLLKVIFFTFTIWTITSCSEVLQTIELRLDAKDKAIQQNFDVIEKTLTIKEARRQNETSYERTVLQKGRGKNAKPIPEKLALISNFPKIIAPPLYKIGVGDTLTFSQLIENNRSSAGIEYRWPQQQSISKYKLGIGDQLEMTLIKENNTPSQMAPTGDNDGRSVIINSKQEQTTIVSKGRIGSDGSVLLLDIGRLEANGKSLNELRSEVRNILIRNGVSPRFQLEIVEFKSQKAYLTVNSGSTVITLNDQKTTVKDILASANVGFQPGIITRITLQRSNQMYTVSLRDIFNENAPDVAILAGDHIFVEDTSAKIIETSSIVDHEGNVIFEGIGKLKAVGLSVNELETKIEELIQQLPDSQNAFQIKITKFSSKTALVNISKTQGAVVAITDIPKSIYEVLTDIGLSLDDNMITQINLHRDNETYTFTLDDLQGTNSHRIYLQSKDRVTVDTLTYKENKVFMLGGVSPQIFKINPATRETLADILFTNGGPLSSSSAKRSEVYLLRGSNPVVAYHLDAQSPTRLIVADAMELRPNDILYVAEQPIISFNRTLATIVPLRILLRDLQDENIP